MPRLLPHYDFSNPALPTTLYAGDLVLSMGKRKSSHASAVQLSFFPSPQIRVEVQVELDLREAFRLLAPEGVSITLSEPASGQVVGCIFQSAELESQRFVLRPQQTPVQLVGDFQSQNTHRAICHFFNLPFFQGGTTAVNEQNHRFPEMVLTDGNWRVRIQSQAGTDKEAKEAEQAGLPYFSHVGCVERVDGALFSATEIEEFRPLFESFTTFLCGGQRWPVCWVGLNGQGQALWQNWEAPVEQPLIGSWFAPTQPQQAEVLFPLFSQYWQRSPESAGLLHSVIYWYAQANTKGGYPAIDAALILAQAALERLAHFYVVEEKKALSAEGFKKLRASDQLRLLFGLLNIPVAFPESLQDSTKSAIAFAKLQDVPHFIIEVRNQAVHPEKKYQGKLQGCTYDAWRLSLWCIELGVLAICGYQGKYWNRIAARSRLVTECVPWRAS